MKSEIVSIGTELLLGEIADTNTQFLAGQLASLGIDLYFTSSVGDNFKRLSDVLKAAWQRSELILTTGGLGPTQGDITRQVIAALVQEEMRIEPSLQEQLISFFARRGLELTPNNLKQATLIPSATALLNPRGTAPGWWVEKEGRIIVAMPGPPGEMQFMWANQVFPRLQGRIKSIILSRTLKTLGLSESKADALLAPLIAYPNPTLATYAKADGIHLRITAKAAEIEEARRMIANREAQVRKIIGDYIWGVDEETLESVADKLLLDKGLSLAVAESFTGGFLTSILAGVPQSQGFFKGGITVTSDESKTALGLISSAAADRSASEKAAEMASLVRRKFGADVGIGIEGYGETVDGMEIGKVYIAIARAQGEPIIRNYSGRYSQMKRLAAYYALADLRKMVPDKP